MKIFKKQDVEKRRLTSNIESLNSQIEQKKSDRDTVAPEGLAALNAEIEQLRRQRNKSRSERRTLNTNIDRLERRLSNNEEDTKKKDQQILSLEDLVTEKRSEAARESINQIDLSSAIEDERVEVSSLRSTLAQNQTTKSNLERSRSGVRANLNEFERDNIRPIQVKIDSLVSKRSNLLNRSSTLRGLKSEIIRQDNNIAESLNRISSQNEIVKNAQDSVLSLTIAHNVNLQNASLSKEVLNEAIKEKNQFITKVQEQHKKLKELENTLLNLN